MPFLPEDTEIGKARKEAAAAGFKSMKEASDKADEELTTSYRKFKVTNRPGNDKAEGRKAYDEYAAKQESTSKANTAAKTPTPRRAQD